MSLHFADDAVRQRPDRQVKEEHPEEHEDRLRPLCARRRAGGDRENAEKHKAADCQMMTTDKSEGAHSPVKPNEPQTIIVLLPKRFMMNQERMVPTKPMATEPRLKENESEALTPACWRK